MAYNKENNKNEDSHEKTAFNSSELCYRRLNNVIDHCAICFSNLVIPEKTIPCESGYAQEAMRILNDYRKAVNLLYGEIENKLTEEESKGISDKLRQIDNLKGFFRKHPTERDGWFYITNTRKFRACIDVLRSVEIRSRRLANIKGMLIPNEKKTNEVL